MSDERIRDDVNPENEIEINESAVEETVSQAAEDLNEEITETVDQVSDTVSEEIATDDEERAGKPKGFAGIIIATVLVVALIVASFFALSPKKASNEKSGDATQKAVNEVTVDKDSKAGDKAEVETDKDGNEVKKDDNAAGSDDKEEQTALRFTDETNAAGILFLEPITDPKTGEQATNEFGEPAYEQRTGTPEEISDILNEDNWSPEY